MIRLVPLTHEHIPGAVALQRACFPAPFPEDLLWQAEHLARHIELFPEGQFAAIQDGVVIAASSATLISEDRWQAHGSWTETVGGPMLKTFDPAGTTLYGLDISVHPDARRQGIGRRMYQARFTLVHRRRLIRYGTACRIPGFAESGLPTPEEYVESVVRQEQTDRTLSPLLRYGMTVQGVIHEYMEDEESANAAALLEWLP